MSGNTRTVKLSAEELDALLRELPDGSDEMTPLRDAVDKLSAKRREIETRRKNLYFDCSPEFGLREQAYRRHLRKLRGIDVVGADVCVGCQVQFTSPSARRAQQFLEEFVDPASALLARGNREKRNLGGN